MSDLPQGWFETTLGEVVDYGNTQKAEPHEISDDEWVLELEDIQKDSSKIVGRFTFADRKSKSTKNRFSTGDVLYGKLRPYLNKVVVADSDGLCTTEIIPIKQTGAVDNRYVFHWLKGPRFLSYAVSISHGLNMPRLGTAAGRDAPFILAPLPEQRRIADKLDAVLSRVDAARARLDRVPAVLKHFRRVVLSAATSGNLPSELQTADEQRIDWIACNLGAIADVGTGSTPLRSNESFYAATGTPWITSSATSQRAVMQAEEFVTGEAIKAHRLKIYPVGTLLVAMYGEGKTRGQVTELAIPAAINQACAAVRVDENKADRRYVRLILEANYFEMRELAEGGNQPNLNLSKIKNFPLLLPSLEGQREIIRRVESLFAVADRIQAQYERAVERLDKLTPALLAKAFRGELVPQDPNDESAENLLERLKAQTDLLVSAGKRAKRSAKVVVD